MLTFMLFRHRCFPRSGDDALPDKEMQGRTGEGLPLLSSATPIYDNDRLWR